MAQFTTDYYKGTDVYSDGDIEETLLALVSSGRSLKELAPEEVSYPVLYHLSKERENILCWYPFRENARVLEVGAGCGAITGALCRVASHVTSVDLSMRRSRINYERHKQCENLQIYVGNLNDMVFEEQFDYVILNGVLEYAISFTEGKHPYEDFLNNQLRFLKEDGRLLVAIENRFGLKYFAGAPEDHTDIYYLGLNRYQGTSNVRTFSKTELTKLLERCGLGDIRFYYPYPDYKFPNEIFTDETLQANGYGKDYYNFLENRVEMFSESAVAQDLNQEGIMGCLANSFLVDAGRTRLDAGNHVIYAKMNSDRDERFQILTKIEERDGVRSVSKEPLTKAAKEHLAGMARHEQQMSEGKVAALAGTWDGHKVCYPYLTGQSMDVTIAAHIMEADKDALLQLLSRVFSEVYAGEKECGSEIYSEEFEKVFGTKRLAGEQEEERTTGCIRPANIDLICGNIFGEADGYKIIDCEWIFDFWIPKAFLIWRNVNELYFRHEGLTELLSREAMLQYFQISEEDAGVFYEWNKYFTLEYVKANRLRYFEKEKLQISIADIVKSFGRIWGGLYVDYGSGFAEENRLNLEQSLFQNKFYLSYRLENTEKIRRLRFDPTETRFCKCQVYIRQKGKKIRLLPFNTTLSAEEYEEKWDVFHTFDPQYRISPDLIEDGCIQIEGKILYFDEQETIQALWEDIATAERKRARNPVYQVQRVFRKAGRLIRGDR